MMTINEHQTAKLTTLRNCIGPFVLWVFIRIPNNIRALSAMVKCLTLRWLGYSKQPTIKLIENSE